MCFKIIEIRRQLLISACLYLGQVLVGFNMSWTGPIFPKLRDLSQSPLPYIPSETEMSIIAALIYVGAIPGPHVTGFLSNVWGRKPCIIIGGLLLILGYAVLAWANSLVMLYCGKLFTGFGAGIIIVTNLVYVGEIASSNIRGVLLTGLGIFTTCGLLLCFSTGPFLSYFNATFVGLALSTAFTVCAMFIPESPLFHVLKGKDDEVRKTLINLGRENDIAKLVESKNEYVNSTSKKDWIELLKLRSNRRALLITFVLNTLQQSSGFFVVVAFSGSIFEMAGSSVNSEVAMIIIGLCQLCGSSTAPFFVDRNGRKTLLMVSSVLCCFSMLFFGVYFYLQHIHYSGINNVKWLPLLLLIVFFIGYDCGIAIIPNVLVGEMFTINVRSKGSAVAITCSWISGILVLLIYGFILQNYGIHVAFWFFSCSSLVTLVFTIFFVPETKRKTLLEVQEILSRK